MRRAEIIGTITRILKRVVLVLELPTQMIQSIKNDLPRDNPCSNALDSKLQCSRLESLACTKSMCEHTIEYSEAKMSASTEKNEI